MVAATLPSSPAPDDATPQPTASQYPAALKDRAFDLYAHGLRSPAIAAELGVSERTIRNWVQAAIQQLAQDDATTSPETARQQRAIAIESQRAVAASAWTDYQQLHDAYTRLMSRALDPANGQPERLLAGINRLASNAARHLAVVISANHEIARLQGQAAAQATREQRAASQQVAADDAAELLRILTMPIPTPAARPSTIDPLLPVQRATTPDLPSTDGLPAPDFPPLPDHIIAAVMNHYHAMYPDGADPADAPIETAQTKIPAKTATPTPTAATPATSSLPGTAQVEKLNMPQKTKIAAKTATPPRPRNSSSHQPIIAIPSRSARKLKKNRPSLVKPTTTDKLPVSSEQ